MAILVLGSLNLDFVVRCDTRPHPGETVIGSDLQIHPGGKGANQAVAAGRAGGKVSMAGRVGDDGFSGYLKDSLTESKVSHHLVFETPQVWTGSAVITVDRLGENSIVVVPGANGRVVPDDVGRFFGKIEEFEQGDGVPFNTLLLQLEIPLVSVIRAIQMAHQKGLSVMLDPAPAPSPGRELPRSIMPLVDVFMPNQHEAAIVTGRPVHDVKSGVRAAGDLLKAGVKRAVVTLGEMGVVAAEGGRVWHVPAFKVNAIDTTAAGDTFAGALAVALGEGLALEPACTFASAAAAISVTREGAQPSMPYRNEIDSFLRQRSGG